MLARGLGWLCNASIPQISIGSTASSRWCQHSTVAFQYVDDKVNVQLREGLLWKRLAKRVRLIKPGRLLGCGVEEAHPCLAPSGLPLPSSFIPKTSPISSSHLSVGFATSHAFAFILNPFALLAPLFKPQSILSSLCAPLVLVCSLLHVF